MQYVVIVKSSPSAYSSRNAYLFCKALREAGHHLSQLFFYEDGVWVANTQQCPPQDGFDAVSAWCKLLSEADIHGHVCIAAAIKRGVLDSAEAHRYEKPSGNLTAPFTLAGLGELVEATTKADRVVTFQ